MYPQHLPPVLCTSPRTRILTERVGTVHATITPETQMINLFLLNKHILFIGQILVYLLIKFKTFYCSNLRFCTLKEIQTPISRSVVGYSVQLNYVGNLGEWWVSIPLPPESQSGTLPIELQTPYKKPHSVSGEVDFRYRHWKNKSLTITYTLCVS